jgi:hypothetical protein
VTNPKAAYKRTPTLQAEDTRSITPFNTRTFRAVCSPLVTPVLFNINPLDVQLLPPRRGLNQDKLLCSIVHETSSELESIDLMDPIICRCRKHRQLARQKGAFVACFPLDVPMVHLLKPTIVTDNNSSIGIDFAWGEIIHLGSLEFTTDHFDNQSLSPERNDSGVIFVFIVHIGSPSLHTIHMESTNEDDSTSSNRGSSSFPISWGCNVVTLNTPIATTPPPEGTPALLTIPMVPL